MALKVSHPLELSLHSYLPHCTRVGQCDHQNVAEAMVCHLRLDYKKQCGFCFGLSVIVSLGSLNLGEAICYILRPRRQSMERPIGKELRLPANRQ